MTSSFFALLALCVGNPPATGGSPSQRPVTRSFDVFFDLRMNKRLSKQSRRRWFVTPPRSPWRHCNEQACQVFGIAYYSDVTWVSWRLKSPATLLFVQLSVQASKKTSKLRITIFVGGPVTSRFPTHKRPVIRKVFPWDHIYVTST